MFRTNSGGGSDPTRQNLPQIAWFYAWLHRLFLHIIIVVADAIYGLVTGFAKPKDQKFIKRR